jgi:hypothetical protein
MKRAMLPAASHKRYALQPRSSTTVESTSQVEDRQMSEVLAAGFSDSVAAFEAIVREVSATSGFPLAIPGCFVHQVYAIIDDRTAANFELQEARSRGILRHIHVEKCGVLLVRERDYRNLLGQLIEIAERDEDARTEWEILREFHDKVIMNCKELGLTMKQLLDMMGMSNEERKVTITLLKMGFIVFKTPSVEIEHEPSFWFSLPNMGVLISEIEGARKEIVQMIKAAKPYKEILKSKLRAKLKLKSSSMSIDFHIKDVVGAKVVVSRDTAIEGPRSLFLLPDRLTG